MKKAEFLKMRKELILSKMDTPKTANQIIDEIFKDDLSNGTDKVLMRGWKFYVHLNKLFSPLEKEGFVVNTHLNNDNEKVWEKISLGRAEKDLIDFMLTQEKFRKYIDETYVNIKINENYEATAKEYVDTVKSVKPWLFDSFSLGDLTETLD